jgi:hypothetical protein
MGCLATELLPFSRGPYIGGLSGDKDSITDLLTKNLTWNPQIIASIAENKVSNRTYWPKSLPKHHCTKAAIRRVMSLFHLLLVALIQGITEFLPVSSSGHLILLPNLSGSTIKDR